MARPARAMKVVAIAVTLLPKGNSSGTPNQNARKKDQSPLSAVPPSETSVDVSVAPRLEELTVPGTISGP